MGCRVTNTPGWISACWEDEKRAEESVKTERIRHFLTFLSICMDRDDKLEAYVGG